METIEELRSARSSKSGGDPYKDIAVELKREEDPLDRAARLEAASILSVDGVKQFSITFDAPLIADEGEETNIDDLKVCRLIELHDELRVPQFVVYTRSQTESDKLYESLTEKGKHITVVHLSKGMTDRARDTARLRFQAGFDNILITNDEVPNHRGLELVCYEKQTILVFNYDIPNSIPAFSKRIGRRILNSSRKGVVINMLSSSKRDDDLLKEFENFFHMKVKSLNANTNALKELEYFLHFCS